MQALHHEVREETGLDVEILADERFRHPSVGVVAPPFTILIINDVPDPATGPHTHIDLVYLHLPPGHAPGHFLPRGDQRIPVVPAGEIEAGRTPPEIPALVLAAAGYASRF